MVLLWVASIDLEVDKSFAAWLTGVGSTIVFLATVLIIVFGATFLTAEEQPAGKRDLITNTDDQTQPTLTIQVRQNPLATSGDSFTFGFVVGSITTFVLGKLLRK